MSGNLDIVPHRAASERPVPLLRATTTTPPTRLETTYHTGKHTRAHNDAHIAQKPHDTIGVRREKLVKRCKDGLAAIDNHNDNARMTDLKQRDNETCCCKKCAEHNAERDGSAGIEPQCTSHRFDGGTNCPT